jgi:tetratricopeptide (TPR) repeat protein
MGKKGFWIATIGILFGFAGGFFFANMLNRQEIDALKAKAARAPAEQKMELGEKDQNDSDLAPDEIRQKIAQADQNPENIDYQKNLGMSLYLYAGMRKDTTLLPDAKRLMLRAYEKYPKDYDLLVALGNVNFDLGQKDQDNQSLNEAREFYRRALEIKPKEVELQTDMGSTYFLENPPQYEKALAEYRKSLQLDPNHTRTLDNLARTLIMRGQTKEAQEHIAKLKKLEPDYPGLPDLESLLAQKK